METVSTAELQQKMLEILLYFDGFCKENGLMYYLCGGGLIGAVRHHGFIPWDDDIDLFMPREDYERLAKIWAEKADTSRYAYCRTDRDHVYHDGGASIRDVNTTEINRHSVDEDICHGIALEIMPIDGCPKSRVRRAAQLYNAFLFGLFNVQRLPDNKGGLIRTVSGIMYRLVKSPERRYRIWKRAEKRMSRYRWEDCSEVTELIGSIKGMLLRHPKKDFDHVAYLDFEGHQVPVMAGYHEYLTKIWGDYMQLPPVEQRVAKHNTVCISTTEPYTKFKGIYYCVDQEKTNA
ncbi:MAG: LicD family protein [Firmicutes bacterium]|nr:LicD family protein [Bacillota bacterium]MBQ3931288.1 LicD family protein [Bacillota bacterium]